MKPGIKTTEFWLVAIVLVGLFALVLFGKGDYIQPMAAIVAPILAGFYAITRSSAKSGKTIKPDNPVVDPDAAVQEALKRIKR